MIYKCDVKGTTADRSPRRSRDYCQVNERSVRYASQHYLRTLRRGRYNVSIYFSHRVPVCLHFAYNQPRWAARRYRSPLALRLVGIHVRGIWSVLQNVDNRPIAAFIHRNRARR